MVARSDVVCMGYVNGCFTDLAMPDWLADSFLFVNDSDGFAKKMSAIGAICIEEIGEGEEGIDLWMMKATPESKQQWLCQYFSGNALLVNIFIGDIFSFICFEAYWLAPMARKIIAMDEAYHAQVNRRIDMANEVDHT